jgi:hypothetical protein
MSNDLGLVLEAADRLRSRAEIAIVLLGDGKEKPALQKRAAELKLPNVQFVGSIPKLEMPAALAAADACLAILKPIPLYATVYPNKVFDYMAAGRAGPAIGGHAGGDKINRAGFSSRRAPSRLAEADRLADDHPCDHEPAAAARAGTSTALPGCPAGATDSGTGRSIMNKPSNRYWHTRKPAR